MSPGFSVSNIHSSVDGGKHSSTSLSAAAAAAAAVGVEITTKDSLCYAVEANKARQQSEVIDSTRLCEAAAARRRRRRRKRKQQQQIMNALGVVCLGLHCSPRSRACAS